MGLLLIVLAFVEGDSVWKSAHQILFGLFGCGSFVLGAAVCYLAILYTRGQDLLMQVFKLLLGLIFASGTVIVFSDIPADLTAAQMIAACYQNGANAGWAARGWASAGRQPAPALRALRQSGHGGAGLCASLYIFDIYPAECLASGSAMWAAGCTKKAWRSMNRTPPAVLSACGPAGGRGVPRRGACGRLR